MFNSGEGEDLASAADQGDGERDGAVSGTFLLASGQQPLLDGVTRDGRVLAYHDGTEQFAVATSPGSVPVRLAENRFTTGVVVSGHVIISLHDYRDSAVRLSAWAMGERAPRELDTRAYPLRAAIAASPQGHHVAYVRVADLNGEIGHIQIRRRDGTGVAVSPMLARDIDLLRCRTELAFWDEVRLVAFYCQRASGVPRVVIIEAESGRTVELSDPAKENVEQVLFVPGGRILWTNLRSSTLDPGALKAGTVSGDVRQVLVAQVPPRVVAQLTLSPDGAEAYFLNGTGALVRVPVASGGQVVLTSEKVDRIAAISPDGRTVAVLRSRPMQPDRLSLVDTVSKESRDVPGGPGLQVRPPVFTADSSHCLYLTDGDVLGAFAVRGPAGAPRLELQRQTSRHAALFGSHLLVLHGATMGENATASVLDVLDPAARLDKERGLNASPAGFWLLVPDGRKLLFVRGGGVYMTTLP